MNTHLPKIFGILLITVVLQPTFLETRQHESSQEDAVFNLNPTDNGDGQSENLQISETEKDSEWRLTKRGPRVKERGHRQKKKASHSKERGPHNKNGKGGKKNNNMGDPDKYLEKFGYLPVPKQDVQHSPEARKEAIKNFQRMAGMKTTGKLDKKTLEKMESPRCGMPDMIPEDTDIPAGSPSRITASARYYVPGYKWSKTSLTWKVLPNGYTQQLSQGTQRSAFTKAFKHWSDVTPLRFRETGSNEADIEIKFAAHDHGDGYGNRFDGAGGTLAHAFYPENGDTHFDDSEQWTERSKEGTNLEIVAAHEFGHALGLGHSNIPTALMAPFYQGYDPNFKLTQDDIEGIRALYGANMRPTNPPKTTPRPTVRPTKKPTGMPSTCAGRFDDVYQDQDGYIYAFVGKWVWRLGYWAAESGFPKQTRKLYTTNTPPYSPRAVVYSWRTRYTYFFKGNKIFKFYGGRRVQKKTVRTSGYPLPQAAVMPRDGRIYILSGSNYWLFDESRLDIVPNSRGSISAKWRGVPNGITAATRLSDGYIYFFKGAKYRKYSEASGRVISGPKLTAPAWIGPKCSSNGRYVPK